MDLHGISQAADDLVVDAEVSSHAYYDKVLHRPEWPGGGSGVTWGIGYDGGQSSAETIGADWQGRVPDPMLAAMVRCAGVTGERAHALLPSVQGQIDVPWDVAMAVFADRDIPKYLALCRAHLPHFDELGPDCKGVLFSLVYNRDAGGFESPGDRYREMRAIKAHMVAREFAKIPAELRAMKRLWPTMAGLRTRRDNEAALFERGFAAPLQPAVTAAPSPKQMPVPPPPAPSKPPESLWGILTDFVARHTAA